MKDTYGMYDALDNICFKEVDSMGNHGVSERGILEWEGPFRVFTLIHTGSQLPTFLFCVNSCRGKVESQVDLS